MIIVGLDLSLTSTGLCVIDYDAISTDRLRPRCEGHDRLDQLLSRIMDRTAGIGAGLVVIEGPSYGSKGSAVHQIAGLWWLVAHQLWQSDMPYAIVSPQTRAMYATGRGNAGKDEVLAAVVRRHPDVPIAGHDDADALVLAAMGARWASMPVDDVPATHLRAMRSVIWPEGVT